MDPRRLLVIDDNRDAADSLALLLRSMGHEARACYDGAAGLEEARRMRPDVVFLDLVLPGLDGFEVARQLRADPRLARTLIVGLSGFGADDDRARALAAGFDHHLVKPLDLDFVKSLLGRRR